MVVPDASKPDFKMPDRSLPKSISAEALHGGLDPDLYVAYWPANVHRQ